MIRSYNMVTVFLVRRVTYVQVYMFYIISRKIGHKRCECIYEIYGIRKNNTIVFVCRLLYFSPFGGCLTRFRRQLQLSILSSAHYLID